MIGPVTLDRLICRAIFIGAAAVLLFFRLMPLSTEPQAIPGPDLLLCIVFAFVQRRPDVLTPLLLVAVMLVTDLLLMRPPGLWTLLVLVGAEFLRSRHSPSSELPFLAEWGFVAIVLVVIHLADLMILAIIGPGEVLPALTMVQLLITVSFYPPVYLASRVLLGAGPVVPEPSGMAR